MLSVIYHYVLTQSSSPEAAKIAVLTARANGKLRLRAEVREHVARPNLKLKCGERPPEIQPKCEPDQPILASGKLRHWDWERSYATRRDETINRIGSVLRAALNLAAAHDQRINNHTAWRIGLATIFGAAEARNVILSDDVIRNIITVAFGIGGEFGLLVEVAAVTGARVSQIANLRVEDLQADRADPRLMMPSSRKGRGLKKVTHVPVPIPTGVAEKLKRTSEGKVTEEPLLTKPSGQRWKQSDHSRLFQRAVLRVALDPSEITLYALRHSSIVRDLLSNVPVRIVATKHDTSIPMIECNYSEYIADHADLLSRRAMLDTDGPVGDKVMSLMYQAKATR